MGSSGVIPHPSAVIARNYQNWKVHDRGFLKHPKFQESIHYLQSYVDLKIFEKTVNFFYRNR